MKVLIVTFGDIQNPTNGYLMRVNYIFRCLNSSTDVNVIQFITDRVPIDSIKGIYSFHLNNNYASYLFTFVWKSLSLTFLLKNQDVVMIEGSMFLPFAITAKILRKKVVYDTHGSIVEVSKGVRGIKNLLFRRIIGGLLDRVTTAVSDVVITVSEKDAEIFKKYSRNKGKVVVVRHSIDTEKIPFYEVENQKVKTALFAGNLRSVQNYEAAKKIIEIAKQLPEVKFVIVGEGKEKFTNYPDNVIFVGKVESLDKYYKEADVCVIPLTTGTGIKTKVLECMAYGRPVITTEKGIEGLIDAEKLEGVLVDRVENFPTLIKKFELKRNYYRLREYVEKKFSIKTICEQLIKIFKGISL